MFRELFLESEIKSQKVVSYLGKRATKAKLEELDTSDGTSIAIQTTLPSNQNVGTHWYYTDTGTLFKVSGTRGKLKVQLMVDGNNDYSPKGLKLSMEEIDNIKKYNNLYKLTF